MAAHYTLAPPRRTLAGARIGVLDNNKPNAGLLHEDGGRHPGRPGRGPAPLVFGKNAALSAPEDVLAELRGKVDLVITGSAD